MKPISEKIVNFFEQVGYPFKQVNGEAAFTTDFSGDTVELRTLICYDEDARILFAHTRYPISVPKPRLPAIAELITSINNYCIGLGSFDLDLKEGSILFETGIKIGDIDLEQEILISLILDNCLTMNFFFPAIASVAFANTSPKEALRSVLTAKAKEFRNKKLLHLRRATIKEKELTGIWDFSQTINRQPLL